jgi:hypothetical protein
MRGEVEALLAGIAQLAALTNAGNPTTTGSE